MTATCPGAANQQLLPRRFEQIEPALICRDSQNSPSGRPRRQSHPENAPNSQQWRSTTNYLARTPEHLHQRATSVSIPEPQILDIRQILKRMLLALLLVHRQRIPPRILPPQHHVQDHRNADQDGVTADDALPDARVVVADFLGADPEWADDVA